MECDGESTRPSLNVLLSECINVYSKVSDHINGNEYQMKIWLDLSVIEIEVEIDDRLMLGQCVQRRLLLNNSLMRDHVSENYDEVSLY